MKKANKSLQWAAFSINAARKGKFKLAAKFLKAAAEEDDAGEACDIIERSNATADEGFDMDEGYVDPKKAELLKEAAAEGVDETGDEEMDDGMSMEEEPSEEELKEAASLAAALKYVRAKKASKSK